MQKNIDYRAARDVLLDLISPIARIEQIPLDQAVGRVLAETVTAAGDVPPFDRSPFDGYAFRAADTEHADRDHPAVLTILEEVPAGGMWTLPVIPGTATKILTGAPIPPGADAVTKYEDTEFTEKEVRIFEPFSSGDNVIYRGEDVKQGDLLAQAGTVIDSGLLGTLAAQGIALPKVYAKPVVGILTTGSELVEPGQELSGGKIVNTNHYTFLAAVEHAGCIPMFLGAPGDDPDLIADGFRKGMESCDIILSTGGVSVGDYDYTPDAMERAGAELLIQGLKLKPGGASAYSIRNGKLLCGLSGNPASSLVNFYAVVLPALRKLMGFAKPCLAEFPIALKEDFKKKSPKTRLVRGSLDLSDGTARMIVDPGQGNGVLHSMIGCNLLAEIPGGSPKLAAGTVLQAYQIP